MGGARGNRGPNSWSFVLAAFQLELLAANSWTCKRIVIIRCQCGQKNRVPDKPEAGKTYVCGRCKSSLQFTDYSEFKPSYRKRHRSLLRPSRWQALRDLAILLAVAVLIWHEAQVPKPCNQPTPADPAKAKQEEIVCQDARRPGDPELDADYHEVNADYFGNKLPKIPVLWESRLEEVGPLVARGFVLEGLANSDPKMILLNPSIKTKRGELRRALCHEMVHIYLYTTGNMKTHHGPAFQNELSKLSHAGAFQGISATMEEKQSLRSHLTSESAKLSAEAMELERKNSELRKFGTEIKRRKRLMEKERHELNQRIDLANERGYAWPSDDEIETVKGEIRKLKQRIENFRMTAATFNSSVTNYNAELAQYKNDVSHYNLMMAYPDGLDEDSTIPAPAQSKLSPSISWQEKDPPARSLEPQ